MSNVMTLAIDAMGGDDAPDMVVKGLSICKTKLPGVRFLLVGDERQLEPLLTQYPDVKAISTVIHTDEVVTNDDKPAVALRNRRNSSMRLAINAVKKGELPELFLPETPVRLWQWQNLSCAHFPVLIVLQLQRTCHIAPAGRLCLTWAQTLNAMQTICPICRNGRSLCTLTCWD